MIPSKHTIEGDALRLTKALLRVRTSPTVLYLLRLPAPALAKTELGVLLLEFCEQHGFRTRAAPPPEFFAELNKLVLPLRKVPGSFYVVHKRKEEAIKLFRQALAARRRRHPDNPFMHMGAAMPFCFQTLRGRDSLGADEREFSDSLFVLHSCPEDALHQALDMLSEGCFYYNTEGKCVRVTQVYEHRLHETFIAELSAPDPKNRLAYLMVDWEVKRSEVEGRLSLEELEALYEQFPLAFYREMLRIGGVSPSDTVLCTVKAKSRDLPGLTPGGARDRKVSMHALFNVCAVPADHLQEILRRALAPYERGVKAFKDRCPEVRAAAFVDKETGEDQIGDCPFIGFDAAGITGKTGIAMLGSRKSAGDPHAALAHQIAFCNGEVRVFSRASGVQNPMPFQPAPVGGQHDVLRMPRDQALRLMYWGSCSAFKPDMVAPRKEVLERCYEAPQSRTAARHHAASVGPPARGGPGSACGSVLAALPEQVRDYYLKQGKGHRENPNAAKSYAEEIRRLNVEGADPDGWLVVHVSPGGPCVVQLADKANPTVHSHSSNGNILARNTALGDFAFMRCPVCSKPGPTHEHIERLGNVYGLQSKWYRMTGEGFSEAVNLANSKIKQMQHVDSFVSRIVSEEKKRKQDVEQAKKTKKSKCEKS